MCKEPLTAKNILNEHQGFGNTEYKNRIVCWIWSCQSQPVSRNEVLEYLIDKHFKGVLFLEQGFVCQNRAYRLHTSYQ